MQAQQLMLAMEDFYQSCYPKQTATLLENKGAAIGVVNTSTASGNNVVKTTGSSGNLILKFIIIGGLIYLGYYLVYNYSKMNEKDESNKQF